MAFTNLRDATREDWDRIDALDEARTDYAAAPLALLESLNGGDPAGYTLNPYDHSRQAATRALRAGESSQFIVSVLFHDAADRLAPANHGQIAAELLRPFVDDDHYWMVKMHGLFQKENFTHHSYWGSGVLDAMLDPYRDHPGVRSDPALLPRLRRDVVRSGLRRAAGRSVHAPDPRGLRAPVLVPGVVGAPSSARVDPEPADVLDAVLLAPEDEEDRAVGLEDHLREAELELGELLARVGVAGHPGRPTRATARRSPRWSRCRRRRRRWSPTGRARRCAGRRPGSARRAARWSWSSGPGSRSGRASRSRPCRG